MAAKRNLHDPDQLTSASTIAREIICEHIDEIERVEAAFLAADRDANQQPEATRNGPPEVATDK
jgi:hypothetical protein